MSPSAVTGAVGSSPSRPDGWPKASGEALYGDDFVLPGMLYGATVRSPHARARILRRTWRPERAPCGAVVAMAEDLPGVNCIQLIDDQWPALADVAHPVDGEPVALVAAPTPADARRAVAAVDVAYEPVAGRFDAEAAAEDDVFRELSLGRSSVETELASAARRVEGVYRTGHQEHLYIECQAMTAWFEDGRLHVVGSMQCPYYVRRSLAHAFALRPEQVRVRTATVGGGFGGKEDYPSMIAVHAALLARVAGAPVRLAYDRHEDIVGTTKRHPSVITIRSGISAEGRLEALDIDVVMDGGAYATLSPVVLSRALLHAAGPYHCPAVRVRGRVARTNTAPNGAFRGFGAPQTQFAIERHIDRIAREVGRDPWEVRWDNALRPGDRLPTGQEADTSTSARRCLERVEAETGFRARWREIESRRDLRGDGPARGIGLSLFFHGAGFTGNGERRMRSPVTARLTDDARLEVLTAMADMGQGCAAIFPQLACEAAGLSAADVLFPEPDTDRVPDSGPTVASRATMIIGGTIVLAVGELVERVLGWWASEHCLAALPTLADSMVRSGGASWSFREVASAFLAAGGDRAVTRRHEPPDWQVFDEETQKGAAYPTYSWGADVVEVEVDPVTLEVRATEVTSVCDVGRAIHPTLCRGQVEGGTLQSVAWALLEEIKMEEGHYLNDRLATYIVPTTMDSPQLRVHLLETPWEGGPYGAKGVGELPMDGGAPATAGAIDSATGFFVASIPATPEALLELAGRGEERRDAG